MKRESGENPGQSRCCNLHKEDCLIILLTTVCRQCRDGKVKHSGVSQKTCKTIIMPRILEERMLTDTCNFCKTLIE